MLGSDILKLLIVIPSLDLGGSQRVVVHLLRNLDRRKFQISLLLLNRRENAMLAMVPDDIERIYCDYTRTLYAVPSIVRIAWKNRPDIILSTLGHLNLLIALLKPFMPHDTLLVARESNIISFRNKDEKYPAIFDFLFKTVYKRFHCIICQSEDMREDLHRNYSIPPHKMNVINNPIDFGLIPTTRMQPSQIPKLVSVGRLASQKGYDRLIKALAKCDFAYEYKIVGGGETAPYETLIKQFNLSEKITLLGAKPDAIDVINQSDCLLLGSYYEGFPNVVVEANACGVPVIAFRAPGGQNEIIKHGVNGWFVDSAEELCVLLKNRLYESVDRALIKKMTRDRYSVEKIVYQYQETLMYYHSALVK